MRAGDAGARGADVEGLGELDEFYAKSIGPAQEDGNLDADARALTLMCEGH